MKQAYTDAIKNRVRIGGMITEADIKILIKDLMTRVDQLEEKADEQTTVPRSKNSRVSKGKASSD
mgnify:CR=1 FL=1|tara:strand:- start:293 stop:487 length:195 start_codon:yes stop_codon:yes gene_type:complete